uniref:Uncharacterized protein n=2 Tax=Parascaris univalens TaxID=6257 RepID=A0A915BSS9_PARUN
PSSGWFSGGGSGLLFLYRTMNAERADSVRTWFVNFAETLGVSPVHGFSELWRQHIVTVVHFLETGQRRVIEETSAASAYDKAVQFLNRGTDERAVTEQLNVESAATGDNLEVVKFMVAIMNEMRITHAGLFDPQYGLSPSVFQHLKEIFRYLDEQSKWDTIDSWPAILSQGLAEESYNEMKPPTTPKQSARKRGSHFATSQRRKLSTAGQSPLAEVLSSPRIKEARLLREKDSEIRRLRERCDALEYEKDVMEARMGRMVQDLEKCSRRAEEKAALAIRYERECCALKAEVDDWKEKAAQSHTAIGDLQRVVNDLHQLKVINQEEIRRLEFECNEKMMQIHVANEHNVSLTKTVSELRNQNDSYLQQIRSMSDNVEDSRRTIIAMGKEKEEMEMLITSLRERIREEQRDHELQLSIQTERSNDLAAQLNIHQRELEEEQPKEELREQIRQMRAHSSDLEKQLAGLRSELGIARAQNAHMCAEKDKMMESLGALQNSFNQITDKKLELECRLAMTQSALDGLELERARLQDRVESQEKELKRIHDINIQNMKEAAIEKRKYEQQLNILNDSLLKANRDAEEAEHNALKEKSDIEARLSSLMKDKEALQNEIASVKEKLAKRESELSSQLMEKSLALNELGAETRDALAEAVRQTAAVEKEKAHLEKMLAEHVVTISNLHFEINQSREKMSALVVAKAELESAVRQLAGQLETASAEWRDAENSAAELRDRLRIAQNEARENREQLCVISKRYEDIKVEMTRITTECDEKRKEMEEKVMVLKANAEKREQSLKVQLLASEKEATEELRKENAILKAQVEATELRNTQLETSLSSALDDVRRLDVEKVAYAEESAIRLSSLSEQMESEKQELNAKLVALEEKCARLTADKMALSEIIARSEAVMHSELRHLRCEHDSLWEEARGIRLLYDAISVQYARSVETMEERDASYVTHIEALRNDRKVKEEAIRDLTQALDSMRKKNITDISQRDERILALETEREERLRELDETKANLACCQCNLEVISVKLSEAREEIKKKALEGDQNIDLKVRNGELSDHCKELQKKLDRAQRELNILVAEKEELLARLEDEGRRCAELREELSLSREVFKPARDVGTLISMTGAPHPKPNGSDEGDNMISTTVSGDAYAVNVPDAVTIPSEPVFITPPRNSTWLASQFSSNNLSSDSLDSVNSVRMRELQKRNTMYPPHLRSAYPLEVASRFSERDIHEDEFRNSENFVPPQSHGKHKGPKHSFHKIGDRLSRMLPGAHTPKSSSLPQSAKKPFAPHN